MTRPGHGLRWARDRAVQISRNPPIAFPPAVRIDAVYDERRSWRIVARSTAMQRDDDLLAERIPR